MASGCRCDEFVGGPPLTLRTFIEWVIASAVVAHQIWLQSVDPLQLFRVTVMVALFVIMLREAEPKQLLLVGKYRFLLLGLALTGLYSPFPAALLLMFLAWERSGRLPAVLMALLVLPWDPWIATQVQWPLQVMTAELAGLLSGINPSYDMAHPFYGDTVYLRIPCDAFCGIAHHNVEAGMVGYEPFRINEQCAGLNQVEGLFALTGAVLLLLAPQLSRKHDLMFIAAAPLLAIIVNGIRVAFSVGLGRLMERGPWEGWLHDLPSYIVFALAVFAMAVTARRLSERRG